MDPLTANEPDDEDYQPVTFLGRLRQKKWIVWLTIIGLVAVTIGASWIVWLLQIV